jgi:putative nucleotidyltransferase with HDIG domain
MSPGTDPSNQNQSSNATRHPAFFFLYILVVGAAVLYMGTALPQVHGSWLTLGFLWLLMLGADFLPAWLPRGGYSTPASALDFAAILLFGPQVAALVVVSSSLISQLFLLRRPPLRAAYNASLFTLMVAASGHVFLLLGGTPGQVSLPGDLVAVAAAALVYFAVNAVGVSLVIGLFERISIVRVLRVNYIAAAFAHLSNLAIGATAVLVYLSVGLWGLLVFFLPLLAAGFGYRRYFEMKTDLLEFVRALVQVVDEVDPYTRDHSLRVAEYCKAVARQMRVPEREVEAIEYGALLHDLGKIGHQYHDILQKPARLDAREQLTMRAHPKRGADIVSRVRALSRAAQYVRGHHERMDGRGYPDGIEAGTLPLGSRILTVCDAFDAMTSDRSYRPAMPADRAIAELHRCAGDQFDEAVVEALDHLFAAGRLTLLYEPLVDEVEETVELRQVL